MTPEELTRLQDPAMLQVLRQAQGSSPDAFVLEHSKQRDWPLAALAEQLQCRQKFKEKLPQFVDHDILCTVESCEQSSSWWTAQHKASLFSPGSLLDLCGGLGVDSMAFAKAGFQVHYNDIDPIKVAQCQWNCKQLSISLIRHSCASAESCLEQMAENDYVYLDPSRRRGGKRQKDLSDFQPELAGIRAQLGNSTARLLLKLAPQTSLRELEELIGPLQQARFISLDGECKECLVDVPLSAAVSEARREAHCLRRDGSATILHEIDDVADMPRLQQALRYVYIPDPAIVLAQLCSALNQQRDLGILSSSHYHIDSVNAILLSSDTHYPDFPGRVYEVLGQQALSRKPVRKYLRSQGVDRAHLWRCQSRASVAELRQMLDLADGGDSSCLALGLADGKQWFLHTRRC